MESVFPGIRIIRMFHEFVEEKKEYLFTPSSYFHPFIISSYFVLSLLTWDIFSEILGDKLFNIYNWWNNFYTFLFFFLEMEGIRFLIFIIGKIIFIRFSFFLLEMEGISFLIFIINKIILIRFSYFLLEMEGIRFF